ncbi:MAG: histidinol-phosphate transaminase [Aestuariivirgaceae bacterium]
MGSERPAPRPGVLDITAYSPGKSSAPGVGKIHKLSSNESPLGPSPMAVAAFTKAGGQLERYPDGSASALREALGSRYGLKAENIVCGSGSDELLSLIGQAYLKDGDEAIYSAHGFLVYPIVIKANGAKAVIAPEKDFTADVDAMLKRVSGKTKVVFLANPNNPTGTYLPFDDVRRLHAGLSATTLLVLDAAYAEYVRQNNYEAGVELVSTFGNVVMLRTFSKVYGLAGLRVGWAYCPPEVADALNRIRGAFNVNAPAIAAAQAALADAAHVERAVAHNDRWLPWLRAEIAKVGYPTTPSVGNFLLIHFGKGEAPEADAFLSARGLILRRMEAYDLPDALRLTVGSEEANHGFIAALSAFSERKVHRHG